MKYKKLIISFILTIMLVGTSVFAGATVKYVLNKTIDQNVTVGDTVIMTDGLFVELSSYDTATLTFFTIDETDTQKHYITYTYTYEVLVDNVDIEVSSLSDDIIVTDLVATDTTIAITFSLNQEKTFNDGDVINVKFYFEAVEKTGININTASYDELISLGFSESEATEIVALTYQVNSLDELYYYIYVADIHTRFDQLVIDGTITFE